MIFYEVSKVTYAHIMKSEITFIMEYHMNPFDLFGNMSLKDFDLYMNSFVEYLKEKEKLKKQANGGGAKGLGKMLVTLRDYLNFMLPPTK